MRRRSLFIAICWSGLVIAARADEAPRVYTHTLTPIKDAGPLLADHPEFVAPVECKTRYEAPVLIDDAGADLDVRAWRFSYNIRGIIEVPNRLRARQTAVIAVHMWGIDDGQGWRTPEPAGACDFCTPAKNALAGKHTKTVIDPFLKSLRGKVGCVAVSLIGGEDPIRKKLYRSVNGKPSDADRKAGAKELEAALGAFRYQGEPVPPKVTLSADRPLADYFRQVPALDAGPRYNGPGFWQLPVPVTRDVELDADDVVVYDEQGYPALRDFLRKQGIRHVLLVGYATDMCYARTTAGYKNLGKDFNVFLVGDATLATFPANDSPRHATNAAVALASLEQMVTQVSWVRYRGK